MQTAPRKMTEQEFNRLFLDALDETLLELGEKAKTAIYLHIEQKFNIKKELIPSNVDKFTDILEKLFGLGSNPLQVMFIRKIHQKIKIDFGNVKPDEFTLSAYVKTLKQKVVSNEPSNAKNQRVKTFSNDQSEKENNFISLLNLIADPIVIVDGKGNFLFMNTAFERETGTISKDWIGQCFLGLPNFPETSKVVAMKNLQRRYQGLPVEPYELDVFDPKQQLHQFEVNAKTIDFAGQPADLVICRDVTQRNKYEKQMKDYAEMLETLVEKKAGEIKENEEKLRVILDSSPDALMVFNPEAIVTDCNQAAVKMFGYATKQEIIGKNGLEFAVAEDRPKILKIGEDFTSHGGVSGTIEYTAKTKKGIEFPGEFSLSVIKDGRGNPSCFIATTKNIATRKEEEKRLIVSERKYRKLAKQLEHAKERITHERDRAQDYLDVADVLLLVLDLEGNITLLNRKGCSILGCKTEAVLGKNWFELFVPPEERAERIRAHELRVKGETYNLQQAEKTVICTNGEQRIIAWRHRIVRGSRGNIVGTLSSGEDITERKKTRQALKESEEKFRAISTSAMDAIILVNQKDEIIYWNPAAEKIFGFCEQESVGKKLADLIIPPQGQKNHASLIRELMKSPFSKKQYEFIALRKDGAQLPIDLSISLVKLKEKDCVLAIARDISERKEMEAALKQERDMLESMAANLGAGLCIISKDYKVLWANKLMKDISGEDPEGKPCYSVFAFSNRVCTNCGVRKIFETGISFDRHDYHSNHDGNDEWIELIVTPVKDKDGKVVAALELAVNVTERKRLEDKLAEYSQRLEDMVDQRTRQLKQTQSKLLRTERLAAIGELAGMIGHDLRNPLTSIKGAAYFLKAKYFQSLDDSGKEMLSTMNRSIEYSNKIINDLLDYSRELTLELSEETPKAVFRAALQHISVPKNIKIVDQTLDSPQVKVDLPKMNRVVINMVRNAFESMPQGGTLTVTTQANTEMWEISFADTGSGMSKETLSKLWTPLFTTKAKGMGFGLPICRRIVKTHGGEIHVESTVGKGTIFTLLLPLDPKADPEANWIFNPPEAATAKIQRNPKNKAVNSHFDA